MLAIVTRAGKGSILTNAELDANFTNLKSAVEALESATPVVQSVAGKTGVITLVKGDVGLANVDNTSDSNKPLSTAATAALNDKQATLVSGTNIKTINGVSLLGAGNVVTDSGQANIQFKDEGTNVGTAGAVTTINFVGNAVTAGYASNTLTVTITQNTGTVTSVGLSLPAIFTVTNSPVSNSGTLTATLASQAQNLIFASPNGASGSPTFRALVDADLNFTFTNKAFTGTLDAQVSYRGKITAVAALDIDCSTSNYFTKTINGASTFTFSNAPASRSYGFILELTHTSGTVTWPGTVKWPGGVAPALTAGKTHLFVFITSDGGASWRGSSQINYTT